MPARQSLMVRIWRWMVARAAVLAPAAVTLGAVFAMGYIPLQGYWECVFEGLYLYLLWPMVIAAGILGFVYAGFRHHARTGRSLEAPVIALVVTLAFLGWTARSISAWAVDWPWYVSLGFIVLSLATFLLMGLGLLAYTEAWRRLLNPDVVRAVLADLETGRFDRLLSSRSWQWLQMNVLGGWVGPRLLWGLLHHRQPRRFLRQLRELLGGLRHPPHWGSPHCLELVQWHYNERKQPLLNNRGWAGGPSDPRELESLRGQLNRFLDAGQALINYLSRNWAPEMLSRPAQDARILDVLREALTFYLHFELHRWQAGQLWDGRQLEEWLRQIETESPDSFCPALRRLLSSIFRAAAGVLRGQPPGESGYARESLQGFEALARAPELAENSRRFYGHVAAMTWLALAPPFHPKVLLHSWLEICRINEQDLFVEPSPHEQDPEARGAAFSADPDNAGLRVIESMCLDRLREIYQAMGQTLPAPWNQAPHGRGQLFAEQFQQAPAVTLARVDVQRRTRTISSWVYRHVLSSDYVRYAIVTFAVLATAILTWWLGRVAPRSLVFWSGLNTIEHVEDRRPLRNFNAHEFTAMAEAPAWLAMGCPDGTTLINKASRIPRERVTSGPLADLSPGPGPRDFLALETGQDILEVTAPATSLAPPEARAWLPRATRPTWNVNRAFQNFNVLANVLDTNGWLAVLKNGGINRCLLPVDGKGQWARTRGYQGSPLEGLNVADARITARTVVASLGGGGLAKADRASLTAPTNGLVATPEIVKLDADYQTDWAAAKDARNSLWLSPGAGQGWLGPVLGVGASPLRLDSLDSITCARLAGPVAWLGSSVGGFAYLSDRRRMCGVTGPMKIAYVEALAPLGPLGLRAALFAGTKGLTGCMETPQGDFQTVALDVGDIKSMALSPDGTFCAYTRSSEDGLGLGQETRCVQAPFGDSPPAIIVPVTGWGRSRGETPLVVGVKRAGTNLLVVTDRGVFQYGLEAHSYLDCSSINFTWADTNGSRIEVKKELTGTVSMNGSEQARTAVISREGEPLELVGTNWVSLDPSPGRIKPTDVTFCNDRSRGLGGQGEIMAYREAYSWLSKTFCEGAAPSTRALERTDNMVGDLWLGQSGEPEVVFAVGGKVCFYQFASARMREWDLPKGYQGPALVQLRLDKNGKLVCLGVDGTVQVTDDLVLGKRFSPKPAALLPEEVAALAAETADRLSGESVTLASARGLIARYSWYWAEWSTPLPEVAALEGAEHVMEVVPVGSIVFVQTDKGRVFEGRDGSWQLWPDHSRVAGLQNGGRVWASGPRAVQWVPAGMSQAERRNRAESYCEGEGMKKFVEQAVFAWQPTPSNLLFFTRQEKVGLYNLANESFTNITIGWLSRPTQFAPGAAGLFVLDGHQVVQITPDLTARTITRLPDSAHDAGLWALSNTVRAAYLDQNGGVQLIEWPSGPDGPRLEARRGGPSNGGFDAGDAVFALVQETKVLLADAQGALMIYDPATGVCSSLRISRAGERLFGWIPSQADQRMQLLLATADGTTVLTLPYLMGASEQTLASPPDQIPAWRRRQADQAEATAREIGAEAYQLEAKVKAQRRGIEQLNAALKDLDKQIIKAEERIASLTNAAAEAKEPKRQMLLQQAGTLEAARDQMRVRARGVESQVADANHRVLGIEADLKRKFETVRKYKAEAAERREQAKWHESHLAHPGQNQQLLATDFMRVSRAGRRTTYQYRPPREDWVTLHPSGAGFVEDIFSSLAFSESGDLWVQQPGQILQLRSAPGHGGLSPRLPAARPGLQRIVSTALGPVAIYEGGYSTFLVEDGRGLKDVAGLPPKLLANVKYGTNWLQWWLESSGKIQARWFSGQQPVWGARNGELALQCVRDVALASDRELLLATDAGLIVRDAYTFVVIAFQPLEGPLSFLTLHGPRRVLVYANSRPAYVWRNSRLQPLTPAGAMGSTAMTGPWAWTLRPLEPEPARRVMVTLEGSGHPRSLVRDPARGVRFADDMINWLARTTNDLWLASADGLWPFNPVSGRQSQPPPGLLGQDVLQAAGLEAGAWRDRAGQWHPLDWSRPGTIRREPAAAPKTESRLEHPAVSINSVTGRLSVVALDDPSKPAFERGRFYFDNGTRIGGAEKALFCVVSNRCVVRRDSLQPATITGCWRIPAELLTDLPIEQLVRVEPRPGALALVWEPAGEAVKRSLVLSWSRAPAAWTREGASLAPRYAQAEIRWIFQDSRRGWVPFRFEGRSQIPLERWWQDDRFAWDAVLGVGALDGNRAVLATRLGPVVLKRSPAGGFPIETFWEIDKLSGCSQARDAVNYYGVQCQGEGDRPVGLVGIKDGVPEYQALHGPAGRQPVVVLAVLTNAIGGGRAYVGLREEWRVPTPRRRGAFEALYQPVPNLLREGQFFFDLADCAWRASDNQSTWLTACADPGDPKKAWLWYNALAVDAEHHRTFLLLRGGWRIDAAPEAGRAIGPEAFLTLTSSGSSNAPAGWAARKFSWGADRRWHSETVDPQTTREWFRTGGQVNLTLTNLQWGDGGARYPWSAGAPLEIRAPATIPGTVYPLFVRQGAGIALSFDVITSVAMPRGGSNVALATHGGIWYARYFKDGRDTLNDPAGRLLIECYRQGMRGNSPSAAEWCTDVHRVRFDSGRLLVRHADGYVGVVENGCVTKWTQTVMPFVSTRWRGVAITGSRGGLRIGGQLFKESNNASGARLPLSDFVDLAADEDGPAVWGCSRQNGLFKILPGSIGRISPSAVSSESSP